METAILGGGAVAQTFGAALAAQGHSVTLGLRDISAEARTKPRAQAATLDDWTGRTGGRLAPLVEAAAGARLVINATQGAGALAALDAVGAANLTGKVLIDITNPLDFSLGMPPFLLAEYSGPTSLGEQIQHAFPEARVVKAFNTVAAAVMVNPGLIPGVHDLFLAGNDAAAKGEASALARGFGWQSIVDLGDITGARATESLLPIWLRLYMTGGSPLVNVRVMRG